MSGLTSGSNAIQALKIVDSGNKIVFLYNGQHLILHRVDITTGGTISLSHSEKVSTSFKFFPSSILEDSSGNAVIAF